MYKLILPPDQSGYSVTDGSEVIRQQLDGGLGRYRADILNASREVNCQWTVGPDEYRYLRAFYNTNKALAFSIDLYLDEPELTEHVAHFVPDSFSLSSQSGLTFVVNARLEVEPIDNSEYDESLILMVDTYGGFEEAIEFMNGLEKLTNYDLPKIS
jgi:hypothetical protein